MSARHFRSTRVAAGLALLALTATVAACGNDDSADATPTAPPASDSTPSTATAGTDPPPTESTTPPDTTTPATTSPATTAAPTTEPERPTVVLVHGAFAGPSSWDAVAALLREDGLEVVVPNNPLRGPTFDAAAVREALDGIDGEVILVAHSYGGIPITNAATGDPDVGALVYVAAYVPDDGETFSQIQEQVPGQLTPDKLVVTPYTSAAGTQGAEATIAVDAFAELFAADLPAEQAAASAAAQQPLDLAALGEPSGPPAWRDIPSWYLVATADQIIPAELARSMAERAGATVEEIDASHAVLLSQPEAVADLILRAAS